MSFAFRPRETRMALFWLLYFDCATIITTTKLIKNALKKMEFILIVKIRDRWNFRSSKVRGQRTTKGFELCLRANHSANLTKAEAFFCCCCCFLINFASKNSNSSSEWNWDSQIEIRHRCESSIVIQIVIRIRIRAQRPKRTMQIESKKRQTIISAIVSWRRIRAFVSNFEQPRQ